ncbi:hypothetical protein HH308_16490 [Gordonia sp. TBRC 11910]|uniref:Uncharacterized protein n=1 Tax=Gordonia asplenii TaxID=2725283 RepID=A0A848KX41_9ACTN|nr:DUF6390 family protein [Gordonia asplenii]NMO02812.1 hypothetical protein [Gordonia asplenii]
MAEPGGRAGRRLFAQYVYAPNALGYCGPADAKVLESTACGHESTTDLTAIARRFSGAWPYQELVARLTGGSDALDERVVRAYWTGNDLTESIDRAEFGARLLDRFTAQAGAYWKHLTPDLLSEVAPTHAFHVFGVYPWSRLLDTGAPQPLDVLDSCRIGLGRVSSLRDETTAVVNARRLEYDGQLRLGADEERVVRYRTGEGSFVADLRAGDTVALHWDFVCDRLAAHQAEYLEYWTDWQLTRTNMRLAGR